MNSLIHSDNPVDPSSHISDRASLGRAPASREGALESNGDNQARSEHRRARSDKRDGALVNNTKLCDT